MLEELIQNKKNIIDKNAEIEKKKIDFVARWFNEDLEILKKHMDKYSVSEIKMYDALQALIENLHLNLHIEKGEGEQFQLKEINNYLGIKLGYYQVIDGHKKNSKMYCEQTTLIPTEKGKKIKEEYIKLFI